MFRSVVLVWDGNCGFCRRSMRVFKALDVLGRIIAIPSTETSLYKADLDDYDPSVLTVGIWVRARGSRRVYIGFDGFRRAVWVMPVVWVILPFLYLPGATWLGRQAYGWVAKHRGRW